MSFGVVLLDFILAIPLFFLLNYFDFGKKKDRLEVNLTHVVFPLVYLVVLAAIYSIFHLSGLTDHMFLIPIFECMIRTFYINRFLDQDGLVNHKHYYFIYAVIIFLSYLLCAGFISKVDSVLPDASEFRTEIWFLILIFLYVTFRDRIHIDFLKEGQSSSNKKQEYIVVSYAKLRNRFRDVVETKENQKIVSLLYAIMIYENLQTPPALRAIQRPFSRLLNRPNKSGIMQMSSKTYLTDQESILLAGKKIRKIMEKMKEEKKGRLTGDKRLEYILMKYRNHIEYTRSVVQIYHVVEDFCRRDSSE